MTLTIIFNPLANEFQYVNDTSGDIFYVKDPVDTYNDLPVTGNVENDMRCVKDEDKLYVWSIAATSGSLSDWILIGRGVDWTSTDQNLDTSGSIEGNSLTDGTATLTGGSLTVVKLGSLTDNGFVKTSGADGTLSIDTTTYLSAEVDTLASVTGRGASTDVASAFTTGITANVTGDCTGSAGSCTGNAATVTGLTLNSEVLTLNTGALTLTPNADDSSVLTIGSGAVSVSGANTGDNTVCTSGDATTAETLKTGRTIGGVSFNGSANITVASATGGFAVTGGNLTLDTNDIVVNTNKFTVDGATGNTQVGGNLRVDKNLGFDAEQTLTISSGGISSVVWDDGNKSGITLTESITLTMTKPTNICNVMVKVVQGGVGSFTITWATAGAETILWAGGTAPTLSTAVAAVDIINLYWDGTYYYGSAVLDFS